VLLLGIDGGSWDVIDPLIKQGVLPGLSALAARGVTAGLESVEPVISPTVWTTIATGRSPAVHGIDDFRATRYDILVPTAWERMAGAGLRVGLYDYLLTWPPMALPGGAVVPGWLRRDERVYPDDLFARLGVERFAHTMTDVETPAQILDEARRETRRKPEVWNRIWQELDLDVGAVTFYSNDAVSHRFWQTSFPADGAAAEPPAREDYRGAVQRTLIDIDAAVAAITTTLAPDDAVVVVSDHGFGPIPDGTRRNWAFRIPTLLDLVGLDPTRDRITKLANWNVLELRVDDGEKSEREAVCAKLRALAAGLHDADGRALFEGRLERADGAPAPAFATFTMVPDQAVLDSIWPRGSVEIDTRSLRIDELAEPNEFSGTHRRTGIFIAAGGPFRHASKRSSLSVLDIAPLLFYLAGQPVPDDLEGRVPRSVLPWSRLLLHPVRYVDATSLPVSNEAREPVDAAGSDLDDQLRTLGYIE
jgi:hypothetical protein